MKYTFSVLVFLLTLLATGPVVAETSGFETDTDFGLVSEPLVDEGETTFSDSTASTGGLEVDGTTALAPAPEITSDEQALDVAQQLVSAIQLGDVPLIITLTLLLLVYAARRTGLLNMIPDEHTKWVVAGTTITGYVIAALSLEGAVLVVALRDGLIAGAAAVGLGEMVLKHYFGKAKPHT